MDDAEGGPDTVLVRPLRSYEDDAEGFKRLGHPPYRVSRRYGAELRANGLVEEVGAALAPRAADAPVHHDKRAPTPENMAVPEATPGPAGITAPEDQGRRRRQG